MSVESRLNIFHCKFNWRIFSQNDLWISCPKLTQILINKYNYYEPLHYPPPSFFSRRGQNYKFYLSTTPCGGSHMEAAAQLLGMPHQCAASDDPLRPTSAWNLSELSPGVASSSLSPARGKGCGTWHPVDRRPLLPTRIVGHS